VPLCVSALLSKNPLLLAVEHPISAGALPPEQTSMRPLRVYEELIDFIATGPSSAKVVAFRPSEATPQRAFDLVRREKGKGISAGGIRRAQPLSAS
jgi:hypothetical protein